MIIGDLDRLPSGLKAAANQAVLATQHCTGLNLIFALSYGSRQEIVEAAKALAEKVKNGDLDLDGIDEALFAAHLSTYPAPDVDLIIRTSGEKRISNFLLWQSSYSEFYFSDTLWPDFSRQELAAIISDFSARDRRFGKVKPQHEQLTR